MQRRFLSFNMIIDFHTHVFPERIAEKTVSMLEKIGNVPAFANGTEKCLADSLSRAGATLAVNLPVLTKPSQFDSVLDFAIELNKKRQDVGSPILSFAGAHPAMDDVEEKLLRVKEAGILGVKMHPDYQGTFFDDERYVRIISEAKKLGLIVVTHSGFDIGFRGEEIKCTPKRVLRLLDKVGGYSRLVLAHLGGSELTREVIDLLCGEDVYFDTAYNLSALSPDLVTELISKHGADRILFATDSPWQNIRREVDALFALGLSERERKMILSENAKSLLRI